VNGLMTEREWRKQYVKHSKARPSWWGAQYILPVPKKKSVLKDRSFHAFLLMLSLIAGILMPNFVPLREKETFVQFTRDTTPSMIQPRSVSSISYVMPDRTAWKERIFTHTELSQGKMLMLDEAHPLPKDALPPNTFSIAAYGRGMVPVSSLGIQSGRETIEALQQLFLALREKGVSGLRVCQGTLSAAQQKAIRLQRLRELMRSHAPQEAVRKVLKETDSPATGEMLREFTVELRFQHEEEATSSRPLESFSQGQILLQTAWRYGFVRTAPNGTGTKAFRFRYVGKAHAMAMTYLNLGFEDYLQWLHEKKILTIYEQNEPIYLILCKPVHNTHISFELPADTDYEASLDNLGYAVVVCRL